MSTPKYTDNNTSQCWHCLNRINSYIAILCPHDYHCRIPVCKWRGKRLWTLENCIDFTESNENYLAAYRSEDILKEAKRREKNDI